MKYFVIFLVLVGFVGIAFGQNSTESKEEFIYILNGAAKNESCQYDDVCFSPSVLIASPNTKVTWFAQESGHKITSGTRTQTDNGILTSFDGKFQSNYLNVNDTFSYTFTESGKYDFHSLIFGHASGKVIITKSNDSPTYHSEEKCDLRQDLKIYDKLLQNDSVVRTFLIKFPTAISYVNGIDESSPLKTSIVYEYGSGDEKISLTVYIRAEGVILTDCFSPVFYTYKYYENNDPISVQYYYREKQQMVDFLNDHIISSPFKQLELGKLFDEIQCKQNLLLIQKYDGSPACVKPKSINSLIFRGWADEKFRTLPIIDFQNPDRIFREVGYLGLMMFLPHIEENQTIAISLEGKSNMVLPIIQRYDVEILSEKTNTDKSFSSIFGKITKPNLQKFFEENPMNIFVKRGVLLTSLGGYQDNTGTYGPFNQFLTDNESQIAGDILTYYENKRTNGEDVHFSDFVKWPTGKINESFLQKSKLLDIAEIEENRIALNPTDTCAHISLRLLSADKLAQYHTRDKEIQFFEITDTDLKELPVLDELIRATHHLEFTTNEDAHAEISLRELVDYEFFIMEKAIGKYDDSQDDYFVKLDGNLDEKLADPKPQGFSNEFLSPQLVYDDNVYVLSHTVFWVANEHETQSISVHLRNSIDNDKKFITLTEKDMESIPKIKQAIEKIGTEFESIVAYKGLPENPDWNEYREWFGQKKTEQFNLDETYVPGFVYNDEYYDLGFPIC
ncbi:MAG: hypothetical protein K5798_10305 [Nitrosopumilus sp.]|uniref:cupredoxin domain-containing protein n=1 Tax=Nitrosopumilus sp. TaxID=2024843 RepID=UPI00242DFCCE|nr:hypothetical protein [Nitrosopumilus sp.]MCV0367636.1 hypothetical protein [Nitrosopumilus sp.]